MFIYEIPDFQNFFFNQAENIEIMDLKRNIFFPRIYRGQLKMLFLLNRNTNTTLPQKIQSTSR